MDMHGFLKNIRLPKGTAEVCLFQDYLIQLHMDSLTLWFQKSCSAKQTGERIDLFGCMAADRSNLSNQRSKQYGESVPCQHMSLCVHFYAHGRSSMPTTYNTAMTLNSPEARGCIQFITLTPAWPGKTNHLCRVQMNERTKHFLSNSSLRSLDLLL